MNIGGRRERIDRGTAATATAADEGHADFIGAGSMNTRQSPASQEGARPGRGGGCPENPHPHVLHAWMSHMSVSFWSDPVSLKPTLAIADPRCQNTRSEAPISAGYSSASGRAAVDGTSARYGAMSSTP